jgi:GTP:adenosylcobinamide-phosphate guanylyltransferase
MKRIIAIQARMGSTRLPGKVLKPLGGVPILERIIRAVQNDCHLLYVLSTDLPEDDAIANLVGGLGWHCARGDKTNVLSRYIELLRYQPEGTLLLRLCGDAPLVQPGWCKAAFEVAEACGAPVFIDDLCHVGTRAQWMKCWNAGQPTFKSDLEHAGYSWFSGHTAIRQFVPKDYFTINTPEDYERAEKLLNLKLDSAAV